jgi:hypothetical protein
MISRTLAMPTLLAASIAVPYVATNAPKWSERLHAPPAAAAPAAGDSATPQPAGAAQPPPQPNAALYPTIAPLEGATMNSLADVLRMDVTKEWVYQRWARKSTALAELDLYGIRVPLVTGTQLHDLAGSLTYFFGIDGRLQRISFRGRTGDTTQLVALAHQRFAMQPQTTVIAGEQLLQARNGETVVSQLRTRPAPVLWSSSPHESFTVELDVQDPATARPLPADASPTPTAAATPAPQPPPPAGQQTGAATAEKEPEDAEAAKSPKSEPPGWKAFFPRSRATKPQIENLNRDSFYQ